VLREGVKCAVPVRRHCSQGDSGWEVALGGVAGLVLGAMICLLTYFGLLRIPAARAFRHQTVLIALLAAGMAAQAGGFSGKSATG